MEIHRVDSVFISRCDECQARRLPQSTQHDLWRSVVLDREPGWQALWQPFQKGLYAVTQHGTTVHLCTSHAAMAVGEEALHAAAQETSRV